MSTRSRRRGFSILAILIVVLLVAVGRSLSGETLFASGYESTVSRYFLYSPSTWPDEYSQSSTTLAHAPFGRVALTAKQEVQLTLNMLNDCLRRGDSDMLDELVCRDLSVRRESFPGDFTTSAGRLANIIRELDGDLYVEIRGIVDMKGDSSAVVDCEVRAALIENGNWKAIAERRGVLAVNRSSSGWRIIDCGVLRDTMEGVAEYMDGH